MAAADIIAHYKRQVNLLFCHLHEYDFRHFNRSIVCVTFFNPFRAAYEDRYDHNPSCHSHP
jgi:hypothetical protein